MAKIIVLSSHAESLIVFRKEMLATLARNNQVIACAPSADQQLIQQLSSLGVSYQHVDLARTGLNPIIDFKNLLNLIKVFKQIKPAIVFSYGAKPVIFGSIAARLAGIRNIYSMITGLGSYFVHQDPKSKVVRLIMSSLYRIALGFNAKVFFQNQDDILDFARAEIFNDQNRTVLINGSGVNIDHFRPQPIAADKLSFLLITRFIQAKGLLEYLEAAKIIKQKYPTIEFLLVGWFENKDEAIDQQHIQKYIDQKIICYLGKLDDVRPALARASVFVLPSYREGTPKSVLEAMASGRAIITTDVPGCRETVSDGKNGFLIPAKDIDALVLAMERFIQDRSLIENMGKISRQIAEDKYDVNKVNCQILTSMGCWYAI